MRHEFTQTLNQSLAHVGESMSTLLSLLLAACRRYGEGGVGVPFTGTKFQTPLG
jgi:hypothetical protein